MDENESKSRVLAILDALKSTSADSNVLEKADFLTFVISLLPIPGVSQVGQIANKIINDQAISVQFDAIRTEILTSNKRISSLQSDLRRIGEIANTVSAITMIERSVKTLCEELVKKLQTQSPQLHVETSNWSVQRFVESLVQVDWLTVTAENNSHNYFHNTRIEATITQLQAQNRSENLFHGTTFTGPTGLVGLHNIGQKGDIQVAGASVGFGLDGSIGFAKDGMLSFGPPPDELSANCPSCHKRIVVRRATLIGKTAIECPHCKVTHLFQPPP